MNDPAGSPLGFILGQIEEIHRTTRLAEAAHPVRKRKTRARCLGSGPRPARSAPSPSRGSPRPRRAASRRRPSQAREARLEGAAPARPQAPFRTHILANRARPRSRLSRRVPRDAPRLREEARAIRLRARGSCGPANLSSRARDANSAFISIGRRVGVPPMRKDESESR
jgi:hypothetical protein